MDADVSELEVTRLLDTERGAAVGGGRRRPGTRRARAGRGRPTSRRVERRGSHSWPPDLTPRYEQLPSGRVFIVNTREILISFCNQKFT